MTQEQILQDLRALPPIAQQEVLDFIAFLRIRYVIQERAPVTIEAPNLRAEPFVGMWQDRTDMQDSSQWVRQLRTQEWG